MEKLIEKHKGITARAAFGVNKRPSEEHAEFTQEVSVKFKRWCEQHEAKVHMANSMQVSDEYLFLIFLNETEI